MKLIKYKDNWADEMDIYGFHILSDETWEKFLAFLDRVKEIPDFQLNIGVGSNEDIDYDSVESLLKAFTVTDIYAEDVASIESNFKLPYGQFPGDQLVEGIAWALEQETGEDLDLESDWMSELY